MFKIGRFSLKIGVLAGLLTALPALATTEFIFDTLTGNKLSLKDFNRNLVSGDILVIGEQHAIEGDLSNNEEQRRQVDLLADLSQQLNLRDIALDVGMEFLAYPQQSIVDQYLAGDLTDDEFTEQVGWMGNPFAAYKEQILSPLPTQGKTWALNIPRAVTSQVSKGGMGSLSEEQKALLPPDLELGNSAYFERFKAVMSGHVPEEKIADYFWAQSIWDDTMAWKALQNKTSNSVLVIVAGGFHVEFGGGLPDRLKVRGATSVKSLLQIPLEKMDDNSVSEAIKSDPSYGARADYLWIYQKAN